MLLFLFLSLFCCGSCIIPRYLYMTFILIYVHYICILVLKTYIHLLLMFNLHTILEFPFMTRNVASSARTHWWRQELVVVFARLLHEESRRLEICIHVAERCFREFFNIPVNLSKLPCLLLPGNLKSNTPKEEISLWKPWFSSKAMSDFGRVVSQRRSFLGSSCMPLV